MHAQSGAQKNPRRDLILTGIYANNQKLKYGVDTFGHKSPYWRAALATPPPHARLSCRRHSNSNKGPAFESRRTTKQLVLLDTPQKLKPP